MKAVKKLGSLGALILLCLFLCGAALVVVFEVVVCENVMASSLEQTDKRSAIKYLTERLRNFDIKESVEVRNIEGTDVLVFTQKEQDRIYETWLYAYNGSLCEICKGKVGEMKLSEGQMITRIQRLNIKAIQPNLIKLKIQDEKGREYEYTLFVRSHLKAVQNET